MALFFTGELHYNKKGASQPKKWSNYAKLPKGGESQCQKNSQQIKVNYFTMKVGGRDFGEPCVVVVLVVNVIVVALLIVAKPIIFNYGE